MLQVFDQASARMAGQLVAQRPGGLCLVVSVGSASREPAGVPRTWRQIRGTPGSNSLITLLQLEASAQAPCTSTITG